MEILGITEETSVFKDVTVEQVATYDEVFLTTSEGVKGTTQGVNENEQKGYLYIATKKYVPKDASTIWEEEKDYPLAELDLEHPRNNYGIKMRNILNKFKSLYYGMSGEVVATEHFIYLTEVSKPVLKLHYRSIPD